MNAGDNPPVGPLATATTLDHEPTSDVAPSERRATAPASTPGAAANIARPVDVATSKMEPLVTVEPAAVRLIDPEPAQDPPPAAGETPLHAPPAGYFDGEPANITAFDADSTGEPAADQVSPWSIPTPAGERVSFCFNLAKLTGQGEDADPILHEARDLGLVAVFDGMGGAGGTTYPTTEGPRTGAYLASRAARDVVDRRMLNLLKAQNDLEGPLIAAVLHDDIEVALRARLADLHAPRSGLRSKLLRALPTTMAMAAVTHHEPANDAWECDVLWAGDSRIYLLSPESGLAQLTADDIRDQGDAMANLRQDSVISNAMSADTPFVVNHRRVRLTTPFLLIAATDGCFGYLPSPMHFESLLLSTLRNAPDSDEWSEQLQAQITAISGDDASLAVLGIGADHEKFRSLVAGRARAVETQWVTPLDQLAAEVWDLERQLEVLRRRQAMQTVELWASYRPAYQHFLTADTPEEST